MKNQGKLSATPHVPNITAKKAPRIKEGAGENMPEMRGMKRAAQYTAGGKGSQPAPDTSRGTHAAPSGHGGNHSGNAPKGSHVPRGEHHMASHRAPSSHEEFHSLGHNPKKPY